jgi:polyisoprenoid-binding protein YceI
MALAPGTHTLGPDSGTIEVRTYREGIAQKVGHDLIIDVGSWTGTVETTPEGAPSAFTLELETTSLAVRDGHNGVKPLSEKDRNDIKDNINKKVLQRQPVSFQSDAVENAGGITVRGRLTIVGNERPVSLELTLGDDGRLTGTLPVVQSEWGITPYKALMGALKVRDEVEIVLDVALPTG